ncbi:MAG TPA: sulfatase-like hydrolase/transferase [Polyangiaceae bacterium]|nr:sulfatase-like hydrolase/transferase [Polyangiaceae bacterium]
MIATLTFLGAWMLLNAVANVRYPGKETRLWYLVPSLDIVVLLGVFAALGALRRRVPLWVHGALTLALFLVRLLRIGDGVSTRFMHRPFSLYVNLSLLPEVPRLLWDTVPLGTLVLGTVGVVVGVVLVLGLSFLALQTLEKALTERTNVGILAGVTLVLLAASFVPRARADERYTGAFASSGVARMVNEGTALWQARGYRERIEHTVADVRARLAHQPTNLARLRGADVLLFIVESYGEGALADPALARRVRPELEAMASELTGAGYTAASSVLDSPTFGGGSWLAHAALNTGVRTENQLEYELVAVHHPITLGDFFRDAGYRTVLVQPANVRGPDKRQYLTFDASYFGAAFDYRGPSFGWGTMPDQYVIDFVDRRELSQRAPAGPRFVEYALITSHAPWTRQASVVRDWSAVGDGSIFAGLPIKEHDTSWSHLEGASGAYADALVYDLEVLRRYLADRVKDDTLVIILGDHQPPGGVTGESSGHGVLVHVLSRKRAMVEPFVARGYTSGMVPATSGARRGLETFLFSFLRDFSEDLRQTSAVGGPTP